MTPQLGRVLPTLAGEAQPSLQEQAAMEYAGIADQLRSAAFRISPPERGAGRGGLEFYPPGEEESFDPKRPAIEVFSNTVRPKDVAGDLVSHYLSQGTDPTITRAYRDFELSMTPAQHRILTEQYDYARKNEGETRPFEVWYRMSGLPAYFRGYLFQQWPQEIHSRFYTPQQMQQFDALNQYLRNPPPAKPPLPPGLGGR
jgi:hypothetical protein